MASNLLEFEAPISELRAKIEELRHCVDDDTLNISREIEQLETKLHKLTESTYGKLTPWQVTQVARHPERPHAVDYLEQVFDDFEELHGDRAFRDDPAIIGGMARLSGRAVMVIAQEKGRTTQDKVRRNFGMPRPEGYRKALRLMQMAERFHLPLITLIDTPGAYPGIDAEERGQAEAIARNLEVMAGLKTPIVSIVIGEGGSGGALAIGVCDRLIMLEYSIYSVISPEGCAAILWKEAAHADLAAEAMAVNATALHEIGLVDHIVTEPLGGAHRDPEAAAESIRAALNAQFDQLRGLQTDDLVDRRYQKLMGFGRFEGV
ncbi:MAG: acetyl-CoA carboxylase carboxyltransferase subunit alpha [Gammaproteobacteria bacterium]|nr:acetyl-CoA carboxylase carboxyltransferase subunit alpha [Gammaproteobacteria bacterium]